MSDKHPSITSFRSRIRSLLEREKFTGSRRDVVILAIDGIPYEVAAASWPHADISKMRSVFPTTSSTAWLSSLTGVDVGHHGIPGVVFKSPDGDLINIFEHRGRLDSPATGNIFSDAAALGYTPISVMGDWEPYDCAWRDTLLHHSRAVRGYRFYTTPSPGEPAEVCRTVQRAVLECLETHPFNEPKLIWCFIDADRHIHHQGYDEKLIRFLEIIEEIAHELARRGVLIIAHSDHGLIGTSHSPAIEQLLERVQVQYKCALGGAGRTRWLYPQPATEDQLVGTLERSLPSTIRLLPADEVFARGSLARARVGEIVLIADGDEFITFSGQRFEHGSLTEIELNVPFAQWMV